MAQKNNAKTIKVNEDSTAIKPSSNPETKKKFITPINIKQSDEEEQAGKATLRPPAEKKIVKPIQADSVNKAEGDEKTPESSAAADKPNVNKSDKDLPEDADPDKSKHQIPEFIDEGQYHITVSKSSRRAKASLLKRFLGFVLITLLFLLAAYLYIDFFNVDINYQEIYGQVKSLIGLN